MARALRAHLDEHPVEQLDAIVLAEDAGVDHRREIVNGERMHRKRRVDLHSHTGDPTAARRRRPRPLCASDQAATCSAGASERPRRSATTASSALVSASRCPSVTASMTARLRCSTFAICSSIVSDASR